MRTFIGILLVGLLGFSGCSSSDAESSPAYNVQAFGLVDELGISFYAKVMDQQGNPMSAAMLTINDEPMNIGFLSPENLNITEDNDAVPQPVQQVLSGDYLPYYFLNYLEIDEGDAVNLTVKGEHGLTLYTSSMGVPEQITIIEPLPDATLAPGQAIDVKWEGGGSAAHFQVIYIGDENIVKYTSEILQEQTEYMIPTGVVEEGEVYIFVLGWLGEDEVDGEQLTSSFTITVLDVVKVNASDTDELGGGMARDQDSDQHCTSLPCHQTKCVTPYVNCWNYWSSQGQPTYVRVYCIPKMLRCTIYQCKN